MIPHNSRHKILVLFIATAVTIGCWDEPITANQPTPPRQAVEGPAEKMESWSTSPMPKDINERMQGLDATLLPNGKELTVNRGSVRLSLFNQGTEGKDREEIKRLFEEKYASSLRAGNVDSYVAMFTKDALWIPPGSRDRRGLKEIAEGFAEQASHVRIEPSLTAEEVEVMGNFAYVVGTSLATVYPKDGSQPSKLKFRVVWLMEKEDGMWKIAREIWNSKPL